MKYEIGDKVEIVVDDPSHTDRIVAGETGIISSIGGKYGLVRLKNGSMWVIEYGNLSKVGNWRMRISFGIDEPTSSKKKGNPYGQETQLIESFIESNLKYIKFEYETVDTARSKATLMRRYRWKNDYDNLYNIIQRRNSVVITKY